MGQIGNTPNVVTAEVTGNMRAAWKPGPETGGPSGRRSGIVLRTAGELGISSDLDRLRAMLRAEPAIKGKRSA